MKLGVTLDILNQKATPAFYADTLANRPAAGYVGRVFISTDTLDLYRDTGTTWVLLSPSSTGTITGSGAAGQVTFFSGTSSITGTNNLFWDTTNLRLGVNTNSPGASIDVHSATGIVAQLNQTTATNNTELAFQNTGSGKWRIGNNYNAGANDFQVYDVVNSLQRFSVKNTGQTFVGTQTTSSGLFVVNSATGDNHIVAIGATAPSIRVRNAGSAPTQQFGLGLATATNNFIQGSASGDFCIFNGSTTASPITFGVYNSGSGNIQEAARISNTYNLLVGTNIDNGRKLQINGDASFSTNGLFGGSNNPGNAGSYTISVGVPGTTAGGIQLWAATNQSSFLQFGDGTASADNYRGYVSYNHNTDSLILGTASADRLIITSAGYVGIARSNPEFVLDVNGDIAFPRTAKLQFSGPVAGDRQRSYLTGDGNNNIFIYGPSTNLLATFRYTGNTLIGNRSTDNGQQLQVQGDIYSSSGTFTTGSSFTITALSTNTIVKTGAYSGLIVIRDNTNGGSAVWLADPNAGFIQIANNMPGVYSMNYSGGNTNIQKTLGTVPASFGVSFYSNVLL